MGSDYLITIRFKTVSDRNPAGDGVHLRRPRQPP